MNNNIKTIKELIGFLNQYDENTKIVIGSNDNNKLIYKHPKINTLRFIKSDKEDIYFLNLVGMWNRVIEETNDPKGEKMLLIS